MREQYKPLAFFIVPIFWLISIVMMVEHLILGITLNVLWIIGVIVLFSPISKPKTPDLNVKQELEEFYQQFYETVILPREKQRKIKGFVQKILKLVSWIVILVIVYTLIMTLTDGEKYLNVLIREIGLYTNISAIWIVLKKSDQIKKNRFANIVLKDFMKIMMPKINFNYSYRNWKNNNSSELQMIKSMLDMKELYFDSREMIDYDLTIDYDFGWITQNNTIQKLYNISEAIITQNSTTNYDGLFGWTDINEYNINAIIRIIPNKEFKYVNSEDKVKKYLKVWSDDEISKEMLLPRELLEYLSIIYEKTGIDFEILFKNNKIFYIFPKGHDIKTNELNEKEYKKYLFTYYYAVIIMQETSRIMQKN